MSLSKYISTILEDEKNALANETSAKKFIEGWLKEPIAKSVVEAFDNYIDANGLQPKRVDIVQALIKYTDELSTTVKNISPEDNRRA